MGIVWDSSWKNGSFTEKMAVSPVKFKVRYGNHGWVGTWRFNQQTLGHCPGISWGKLNGSYGSHVPCNSMKRPGLSKQKQGNFGVSGYPFLYPFLNAKVFIPSDAGVSVGYPVGFSFRACGFWGLLQVFQR